MNLKHKLLGIFPHRWHTACGTSLALLLLCAISASSLSAATTSNKQNNSRSDRSSPVPADSAQPAVQWASRVVKVTSQMKQRGSYSAFQLLGKPNILSVGGETNACSWAAAIDGQQPTVMPDLKESIRVGFATPVRARQVAIAENLNPGAVGAVIVYGTKGEKDTVYRTTPALADEPWRILHVFFEPRPFLVSEVELVVYTGAVLGWNEIDAIALGTTTDSIKTEITLVPGAPMNLRAENLGSRINSEFDEFFPVISPDGKTLYVCRNNHPDNTGGVGKQDIWYSELQPDGFWGQLANIGPPLNNNNANFVCSVLPDNNTLLLGSLYYGNGGTGPGISISNRTKNGWSFPQALVINKFYNRGVYVNYDLAVDGRTLLMALERDETYGDMDIYVSFAMENGNWSAPMDLGHDINTAGKELTAFLAPDNRTLYFSSNGHNGYGQQDIFMSRRLDETWTKWSEPQNLGPSINSTDWDSYFSLPASGEYAYFVSNTGSFGGNDIFRLPLPEALRPRPVVLMSGTVLDAKTNKPVEADIVVQTLIEGNPVAQARSNPNTGQYTISLPAGDIYSFYAEAPGYFAVNENVDLLRQTQYEEQKRDLQIVPLEAGQSVDLNNIFFETGKWAILPESASELGRIIGLLSNNPRMSITVIGHTDDVGSTEDNQRLSERRAAAVVEYLVEQGIKKNRLKSKGVGEAKPTTEGDRSKNRRVEFRIDSN